LFGVGVKKIIIAINNDFIRNTYAEVFGMEGFKVLDIKDGSEVLGLVKKEKPDIIILDVALQKIGGIEILAALKKHKETERIPVIIFAQFGRKEDEVKAMELEVRDFIVGTDVTPKEAILKVKIIIGEQRSYRLALENTPQAGELLRDLGKSEDLQCPNCQSRLILYLIKDLSKGQNYFKVSFICPNCLK
jgi:DNA-binding response OmpR family regulator